MPIGQILPGTATLLMGPPGTGKTWSLTTFMEAGLELFVICTDPGGMESLVDAVEQKGLDPSKLHYAYRPPSTAGWKAMKDMAKKIGAMSYKDLTGIKTGIQKEKFQQFWGVLNTCENFVCDACGGEFGDVTEWGPERAFAIDTLTGINIMAMHMMVGLKPAAAPGEYGCAMQAEEQLIYQLCSDRKCFFALTAHVERVMDEVEGRPLLTVSALGQRLAPKLPRTFSDVVLSVKEGDKFYWSTASTGVDLKGRALALSSRLSPDFTQVVDAWKRRNELVGKSNELGKSNEPKEEN